jgi:hypothetical protein
MKTLMTLTALFLSTQAIAHDFCATPSLKGNVIGKVRTALEQDPNLSKRYATFVEDLQNHPEEHGRIISLNLETSEKWSVSLFSESTEVDRQTQETTDTCLFMVNLPVTFGYSGGMTTGGQDDSFHLLVTLDSQNSWSVEAVKMSFSPL